MAPKNGSTPSSGMMRLGKKPVSRSSSVQNSKPPPPAKKSTPKVTTIKKIVSRESIKRVSSDTTNENTLPAKQRPDISDNRDLDERPRKTPLKTNKKKTTTSTSETPSIPRKENTTTTVVTKKRPTSESTLRPPPPAKKKKVEQQSVAVVDSSQEDLFDSIDDQEMIDLEQEVSITRTRKKSKHQMVTRRNGSRGDDDDDINSDEEAGALVVMSSMDRLEDSLMALSDTQRDVVTIVMSGQFGNLLVVGKAGTGKSRLIFIVCNYWDIKNIEYVKMAPTGLAAMGVDGRTIHSWFGLPVLFNPRSKFNAAEHIKKILQEEGDQRDNLLKVRHCKVIIFDEVSMVDKDILVVIDIILRTLRRNNERFGGAKIIFFGDFLQLAPVRKIKKFGSSSTKQKSALDTLMLGDGDFSCSAEFWYSHLLKNAFLKEIGWGNNDKAINSVAGEQEISDLIKKMKSVEISNRIKQTCSVVESGFVFELPWWDSLFKDEEIFVLTKNFRQCDPVFQAILDEMCFGYISKKSRRILSERVGVFPEGRSPDTPPIRLCPVRRIADKVNKIENKKLNKRTSHVYCVEVKQKKGPQNVTDDDLAGIGRRSISDSMIPETLDLRYGSCVMCMANSTIGDVFIPNGKRGMVIGFKTREVREVHEEELTDYRESDNGQFNEIPLIKFEGIEKPIAMAPRRWEYSEYIYGKGLVTIVMQQIPLVLAYATTVHKAQGMALDDGLVLDMGPNSGIFGEGLVYVAFSRATELRKLEILSVDFSRICANSSALWYTCKIYDKKGIPYKTSADDNDDDDDVTAITAVDSDGDATIVDTTVTDNNMTSNNQVVESDTDFHDREYQLFLKNNPRYKPERIRIIN